jgi:photosystem II stability/assembly factor-like uncharacterized protein
MLRSLTFAATTAGVVAALSVACSGTLDPTPTFRPLPGDGNQGTSSQRPKQQGGPTLTEQVSADASKPRFFAISPVNSRIAWASAASGTFAVTTDGGENWRFGVVRGAETLQFRDVEAVSSRIAYLLAAGAGTASRIYKTRDGGNSWQLQFQNEDPSGFYDCFDFWNPNHGLTFADAIGNRFPVIETRDGRTWHDIGNQLPAAQPGEAGFAASGTCVKTLGGQQAWMGTGGVRPARVLLTTDGGRTWSSRTAPGEFTVGDDDAVAVSGVVSIDFRDRFHGIMGGGNVVASTAPQTNIARSSDGGNTWTLATSTTFPGAVYGLTYVLGGRKTLVVATGPGGAAWSADEGDTWSDPLPGITDCWAVAFATRKAGWLVCGAGRIVKVSFNGSESDNDRSSESNRASSDD